MYKRFDFTSNPLGTAKQFRDFYHIDPSWIPEDRPYTYLMFVATSDGRTTFREVGNNPLVYAGGTGIAMGHLKDRKEAAGAITDYRALEFGWAHADAIMGGAGIIRSEPGQEWNITFQDFLDYRIKTLGKSPQPIKVVVTGRGPEKQNGKRLLDLREPIFNSIDYQTIILTSDRGRRNFEEAAEEVAADGFEPLRTLEMYALGEERVDFRRAFEILRQKHDVKILDVQGGPDIASQLLWAKLVNEYRDTIAPQLIGEINSKGEIRPTTISGKGFGPYDAPSCDIMSLGTSHNHIIVRSRIIYNH